MAANEPRMPIGTTGTWWRTARKAAPCRKARVHPSGERVPSGNTTMLQPSSSRSPGVDDNEPVRRSIGKVLKTIAEPVARHQVSKK